MEINTRHTAKLAFCIALAGFVSLILLLPETKDVDYAALADIKAGEKIKFSGTVKHVSVRHGNAFLELENNGTVNAFYYRPGNGQLSKLHKNSNLEVTGIVSLYNGKKEIMVERVEEIG